VSIHYKHLPPLTGRLDRQIQHDSCGACFSGRSHKVQQTVDTSLALLRNGLPDFFILETDGMLRLMKHDQGRIRLCR
jgi:hypothetical protein